MPEGDAEFGGRVPEGEAEFAGRVPEGEAEFGGRVPEGEAEFLGRAPEGNAWSVGLTSTSASAAITSSMGLERLLTKVLREFWAILRCIFHRFP